MEEINIEKYLAELKGLLKAGFGSRLLYIGLQGSYQRKEADDKSDIDVMVILDKLGPEELLLYRELLLKIDYREKACGFICGRDELARWNPCEICHLINTTQDYFGVLKEYVPKYTGRDHELYIKISLDNLYHQLCHMFLYASPVQKTEGMEGAYKTAFFILQNIYFERTGEFKTTKKQLLKVLADKPDRDILNRLEILRQKKEQDWNESFLQLFEWCRDKIREF